MGMLDDLKQAKTEIKAEANGEAPPAAEEEMELPSGGQVEMEPAVEVVAENVEPGEVDLAPLAKQVASDEEEDVIRIGEQEFKSQKEALEYARKLEQDKLVSEAYNMGIKETLQQVRPQEEAPPPEDNFEEKFYSDPKGTLQKFKEEAKQEALSSIKAEQRAEVMWETFLTQYPDIERRDAQRILQENWETVGKMTDLEKAMKVLAQKTRAEYQRIADRLKPRTELPPNRNPQAVSAGRGGVTPPPMAQKEEKVLTMAEQLKSMRRR